MNSDITPINSRSKVLLTQLGKYLVAILFLLSAISKLIAIGQFEITILQQHIVNDRLFAAYIARGVISLELFIGLAFLQNQCLKSVIYPLTFAVTSIFSIHLAYLEPIRKGHFEYKISIFFMELDLNKLRNVLSCNNLKSNLICHGGNNDQANSK